MLKINQGNSLALDGALYQIKESLSIEQFVISNVVKQRIYRSTMKFTNMYWFPSKIPTPYYVMIKEM